MKPYTRSALVADALSLGPHWVYNQSKLARLYSDGISVLTDPASTYHPLRQAGQFTHYGDQLRMLEASIQEHGGFQPEGWRADWVAAMQDYDGYRDSATTDTLASEGVRPSSSNDLAGASRIAPLLDIGLSLEACVVAARSQTALTHGDPGVQDAAEFFVRATFAVVDGQAIPEALDSAAQQGSYSSLDVAEDLAKAHAADASTPLEVGQAMGLTCHTPEAFPLSLYLLLRPGTDFDDAISVNGLMGGDTSARAMLIALLFEARDGSAGERHVDQLKLSTGAAPAEALKPGANKISIATKDGALAGVFELPDADVEVVGCALFAHCFTCGKDFVPARRITQELARRGIATLRIDFSGLGTSEGDFEDTSFVTNLGDLTDAADWLRDSHKAPSLLVGHSLGGAAVLAAAGKIPEVKAVATIGAPADPGHVTNLFKDHLEAIKRDGQAEVPLAGRKFVIGRRFLDDIANYDHSEELLGLRGKHVLILHAPEDEVVALDNAGKIYSELYHPKSFVSLPGADHLLTRARDVAYVADLIRVWAGHSLDLNE